MGAELTKEEAERLSALKARMSEAQRKEMAEVIQNEMERRGMTGSKKSAVSSAQINSGLTSDQVKELYSDVGTAVNELRIKKLEEKLHNAKKSAAAENYHERKVTRLPSIKRRGGNATRAILVYGVCGLAVLKVVSIFGVFDSTIATAAKTTVVEPKESTEVKAAGPTAAVRVEGTKLWSTSERDLLMQLDARRVELEKRREGLDRREQELRNQAEVITERLAEMRGLTAKLQELRKERENKQEGRLAQLANVYGAMEPSEAALLVSRLEENIALELLERMPDKRMGQILGFMEKGRAVDLTKLLTEKRLVE